MTRRKDRVTEFLDHSNRIEKEYSIESFNDSMLAWKYLQRFRRLTPKHILIVHSILMKNLRPDIAGRWRTCNVWIGGNLKKYQGEDDLELRVARLCRMINDSIYWPLKTRVGSRYRPDKPMHVAFEEIHPFEDGNGRVGRIIWQWHRIRLGKPIRVIHEDERFRYYTWFK